MVYFTIFHFTKLQLGQVYSNMGRHQITHRLSKFNENIYLNSACGSVPDSDGLFLNQLLSIDIRKEAHTM